jgi:hypothetical protein
MTSAALALSASTGRRHRWMTTCAIRLVNPGGTAPLAERLKVVCGTLLTLRSGSVIWCFLMDSNHRSLAYRASVLAAERRKRGG